MLPKTYNWYMEMFQTQTLFSVCFHERWAPRYYWTGKTGRNSHKVNTCLLISCMPRDQRWAWTGSRLDILLDTCDFFGSGLDMDIHFEKNWIM